MTELERRYCELRAEGGRKLSGVAIVYGDTATLPGGLRERFEPGAFAPVGDVILNRQHDRGEPLARTGGGGLELDDSPQALRIRASLPPTGAGEDCLTLVRAGVLRGLSIEFRAVTERFEGNVRIIERAALEAVAVVDSGAYPGSTVEARKAAPEPQARRARLWL